MDNVCGNLKWNVNITDWQDWKERKTKTLFKIDIIENLGDNWLIADFGADYDGENYILTTDHIHATEVGYLSDGAKADAELCAKLLNLYHNGKIDVPKN